MPDSNITVSGLAAASGVRQIVLTWTVTDPNAQGLPYLAHDLTEVWAHDVNDRSGAAKIGEGVNAFAHVDLAEDVSRYYWVRPRNRAGFYGEWHPASPTDGVQGVAGVAKLVRAGQVISSLFKTADTGARIEIGADANWVVVYDGSNIPVGVFGSHPAHTNTQSWFQIEKLSGNGDAAALCSSAVGPGLCVTANSNQGYPAGYSQAPGAMRALSRGTAASHATVFARNFGTGFDFYAEQGGYGPFTGAHDALIVAPAVVDIGDLVVDEQVVARSGVSNVITRVRRSSAAYERGVLGIVAAHTHLDPQARIAAFEGLDEAELSSMCARYAHLKVNSVGEGQINVCGRNGPICLGDLLVASDLAGKAMRQMDDVVRAHTVARARESVNLSPDEIAQIACIYMSG